MKIFVVIVGIVLILTGQVALGLVIALAGFYWLGSEKPNKKKATQRTTSTQAEPQKKSSHTSQQKPGYTPREVDCDETYFENILRQQLSEYMLRRQVVLNQENGSWVCSCGNANSGNFCSNCGKKKPADKKCQPLSIGLYLDGQLKLGMILCDKNAWNTAAIKRTMELCEAQNIPCLRFIQQFENNPEYVINRIREALI